MNRIWVLCEEPAEYTVALAREVFEPLGATVAWRFARSRASIRSLDGVVALEDMGLLRRWCAIKQAIETHDVLVLNGYGSLTHWMVFVLNALFYRRPLGLATDSQAGISFPGRRRRQLKGVLLRWLFRRGWTWGLPGGTGSHMEFFRGFGMPDERIRVFPMAVDGEAYRRRFARPCDGVFRFGYLGRLEPHKCVDVALEAFSRCAEDGGMEFHVIGEGSAKASLEDSYGGVRGVRFLGPLFGDDKISALQRLDCLVLVSEYEPWGLVVNEALTAGIPVIVSGCVGARKDLVEGDAPTGLVVPLQDVEALAAAMRRMAEDKELRARLGNAAVVRMAGWGLAQARTAFEDWLGKVKATCS